MVVFGIDYCRSRLQFQGSERSHVSIRYQAFPRKFVSNWTLINLADVGFPA